MNAGAITDYCSIADLSRSVRRHRDWSRADMAQVCAVSPRTVEGWEQERLPHQPVVLRMALLWLLDGCAPPLLPAPDAPSP